MKSVTKRENARRSAKRVKRVDDVAIGYGRRGPRAAPSSDSSHFRVFQIPPRFFALFHAFRAFSHLSHFFALFQTRLTAHAFSHFSRISRVSRFSWIPVVVRASSPVRTLRAVHFSV